MNALKTSQILVNYDTALARVALATVIEAVPVLGRPPGRGFVSAVLTGSLRQDVIKSDAHRLVTFGVLAHMRGQDVVAMLDKLIEGSLLTKAPGKNGLVCSAKGRSLIERESVAGSTTPFGMIPGIIDAERLDLAIRSGLLDALRRFRAERARVEDVAEDPIFSEASLRDIASALPRDEAQLGNVTGMGPKRVAAYGSELLRIVAEHGPIVERLRARGADGEPSPEALEPSTVVG